MRLFVAILLGKLIAYFTKFFKIGGGFAAPGLYALFIEPDLVKKLASRIPKNIAITGTNGKTTTAKLLAHFANASGLRVIRNHTGSNLERGIASTLIQNTSLNTGGYKLNFDLGIWELDEAAFNTVSVKLQPNIITFLNVFRDQLDRYGEIDSVVKNWCNTLKKISLNTRILINGDDSNTLKLGSFFKGDVQKFGVNDYKVAGESIEYKRENEKLEFEAKNVQLRGLAGSSFTLTISNTRHTISLPLPGLYHIYDALAAIASAALLSLPADQYTNMLKTYSPAFGRVEKLPFGYIFLIKNPAGATQVFETISPSIKAGDRLLLALNDNLADGTDISWIWDSRFELLQIISNRQQFICSGARARELAVRLKYAGVKPTNITVEPDIENALKEARKGLKGTLFILPTYTAMLEIQAILTKSGIKKHYWKEE